MKNNKKIIILSIFVCIFIIIICLLFINKYSKKNENQLLNKENSVNIATDAEIANKLQIVINNVVERIYFNDVFGRNLPQNTNQHIESLKSFDIEETLKRFYAEEIYKANLTDETTFYFVKGYFVKYDTKEGVEQDSEKQYVEITVQKNTYNNENFYLVEKYGNSFESIFKYNDDISKTKIYNLTKEKIEYFLINDSFMFTNIDTE